MCLLIFAHRISQEFPLLVAANRDEFYQRPTTASCFWPDHPSVLAGRDQRLGGTWMGVSRDGKFAAVTNFRDPNASGEAPRTRGELPLDYLLSKLQPRDYLQAVSQRAREYAGFNLLVGDPDSLWYFSNNPEGAQGHDTLPRELEPGIYGLSNAHLDTPWPKVTRGKQSLESIIDTLESVDHDALVSLVGSRELADPEILQSLAMDTSMEHLLSAQFIQSQTYGTRSTTTVWRNSQAQLSWREQSYDERGLLTTTRLEEFDIG